MMGDRGQGARGNVQDARDKGKGKGERVGEWRVWEPGGKGRGMRQRVE